MTTAARVIGSTVLVTVLAAGAYVTADAYDLVPGMVTLAPLPPEPAPFPTAPGAVPPDPAVAAQTALDPQAPVPATGPVQAEVDALVDDERMGPDSGVVVADQLTGEVLAAHLPDVGRVPASTAKLATAVAALGTLPTDQVLTTRVVRASASQVVIVGAGDMMLAAGAGDPDAVVGRAGMADLAGQVARELALQGVTSVRLGVDDSLFSGPSVSPGWDPDDVAAGYAAPVTALAVDIAKIRPGEYPPRYSDPSLAAAAVFAERLEEAGITVEGQPRRTSAPGGAAVLGSVDSAPVVDIVHYFLRTSDNSITEVVGRLVALDQGLPGSFDGASQAILRAIGGMGVDVTGAELADASGLADGSELAPTLLLGLLELVTDPDEPVLREVAVGMPIGGLTGTLSDRYVLSPARGFVRAKTGSLPGVTSLAGTVLGDDRRQLLFVVMADDTPGPGQWGARAAIDEFVTDLAACGCR